MFDHVAKKSQRQRKRRAARPVQRASASDSTVPAPPQTVGAVRIFTDGTAPFHVRHEPQAAGR